MTMLAETISSYYQNHQKREFSAQIGTVLVGLLILVLSKTLVVQQDVLAHEEPISLTIVAPPPEPEKAIEQPIQTVQPPRPEKIIEQPQVVVPVTDAPAPVAVPTPPVTPDIQAEPVKAEPQAPRSNAAAEGQFAQDVRMRIERKKIYPDTARDLGMSGEVEVSYELDRAGHLLHAEIATSSGYKLLDQAALKAVKSATYKNFPDDAWVSASSKLFRTKLVFSINQ